MKKILLLLPCAMLCSCTHYVRDFELLPGDNIDNKGLKFVKDKLILETPLDTTGSKVDTNRVIIYNQNYSDFIILTGVKKNVDSLLFENIQVGDTLK